MASFRAELTVDNDLFVLNRIFFTASRKRNRKGEPASGISWRMHIAMDVLEQSTFAEWMFDSQMKKDVTVTFYASDDEGGGETKLKEWTLEATYCFGLLELFVGDASFETTNLILKGKSVSNGNATLTVDPSEAE
ncbi:type VI secretion system tube protein TssD [Spirosoma litoris]